MHLPIIMPKFAAIITPDMKKSRIEKEKDIIELMIHLYCRKRLHSDTLPQEYADLLEYARRRLSYCRFGENKTSCKRCPVHCYAPEQREKIRQVMGRVCSSITPLSPYATIWNKIRSCHHRTLRVATANIGIGLPKNQRCVAITASHRLNLHQALLVEPSQIKTENYVCVSSLNFRRCLRSTLVRWAPPHRVRCADRGHPSRRPRYAATRRALFAHSLPKLSNAPSCL